MRKSSIFLKIYLWFWLATALVVATQIGLDRLTESSPPFAHHLQQTIDTVLSVYARAALESNMSGNNPELMKLADTLKNSTGVTVYLIDPMGRDPVDRSLPQNVEMLHGVSNRVEKTNSFFLRVMHCSPAH